MALSKLYPQRPGRADSGERVAQKKPKQRISREQQSALRAGELLDAAWVLFCQKGYDAVTIEAVADFAGYSRQPVYTLFGDKQNLFFELQRVATEEVRRLLLEPLKPGTPLRQNLETLADLAAERLTSGEPTYGERLFFVAQTIALSRPDLADKLEVEARRTIDAIAEVVRRSTLGKGERLRNDPEIIAAHLAAVVNGITTVQFQTRKCYTNARDLKAILIGIALKDRD